MTGNIDNTFSKNLSTSFYPKSFSGEFYVGKRMQILHENQSYSLELKEFDPLVFHYYGKKTDLKKSKLKILPL